MIIIEKDLEVDQEVVVTVVEAEVEEILEEEKVVEQKCSGLLVMNVEAAVRFLSYHQVINQFTVAIVSEA